jgi:hypothetical protein
VQSGFLKIKKFAPLFARNQRSRKCSNIEFGTLLSLSLSLWGAENSKQKKS